ncbi:MAG: 2-dehydro-3-deoxy-D-gluconate 5-dehydrogenase KduD [Propionibacteriaceae bacterium]|jgi:2-deoxy-D-gluconate 3-dehydrogenase|nr:2-dehydro-3-deoxy-D-gluconate 5-dehydrogenase KduD [Propionibacteriaceae bacterium]
MILNQFKLEGRVALVTGSGRGLGQATAVALAEAGADVALLDLAPPSETAAQIEALGRRGLAIACDLGQASPADLVAVVDQVVAGLGRIDILINNAGIIRRQAAVEFSQANWDDVLAINLDAVFWLSQAAGRIMLEQGSGKIVNICSMLSFQGGVIVPSYAATKHAVAGVTKALANEWAGRGVNVNAIAPGYMATDNTAPLRADSDRSASISDRIPAGRWGTPADLAGPMVFLCSAAADYVHGAILTVDGGWLNR